MSELVFWFDFSCPYAYIASTRVESLAARSGRTLKPVPILLGGLFRELGMPENLAASLVSAKATHNANDIRRNAALHNVKLTVPAAHPLRTVTALRCVLALETPMQLVHAFYRAYWQDGLDISTTQGCEEVLTRAGYEPAMVLARANSDEVKAKLRDNTHSAYERGVFGVPTFEVDGELYFGQDRMAQIEHALNVPPERPMTARRFAGDVVPVDFFFDFSSPFSYIAAARVDRVIGPRHVNWKPMLLGAVFKAVGGPAIPVLEMVPAKQQYQGVDLRRQATLYEIPYNWPSRFPMNSVTALRMLLAAGGPNTEAGKAFTLRVFRAYWAEDRDIADAAVLSGLANEVGLDGETLLSGAGGSDVEQMLREHTDEAVKLGLFGAPAFVVRAPGREPALFWGSDRLEMAAEAARGDTELL